MDFKTRLAIEEMLATLIKINVEKETPGSAQDIIQDLFEILERVCTKVVEDEVPSIITIEELEIPSFKVKTMKAGSQQTASKAQEKEKGEKTLSNAGNTKIASDQNSLASENTPKPKHPETSDSGTQTESQTESNERAQVPTEDTAAESSPIEKEWDEIRKKLQRTREEAMNSERRERQAFDKLFRFRKTGYQAREISTDSVEYASNRSSDIDTLVLRRRERRLLREREAEEMNKALQTIDEIEKERRAFQEATLQAEKEWKKRYEDAQSNLMSRQRKIDNRLRSIQKKFDNPEPDRCPSAEH